MKAIYQSKYGSPLELQIIDKDLPEPGKKEVLVRITATAINDYDWSMITGKPPIYRLFMGWFKPLRPISGMELSGVIEKCGPEAKKFKPGDRVYGDTSEAGFGTFAEYMVVHEKALTLKPDSMSFEEAAALSHAGNLAYQGLFTKGKLQKGHKILINGAGGGVGTLAFQMARDTAAEITGVDTGDKLEKMKELGFHQVIDYKKQDFTQSGHQYDLILDCKTTRSPKAYLESLTRQGIYVTVGGEPGKLIQILFRQLILRDKRIQLLALKANLNLPEIQAMYHSGQIKPVIDGPYSFNEIPQLVQYFGEGKHTGKVVVRI